ncbi:hypothetical protein FRC12_010863, partial [Ceratobasidium sp. 428]
MSQTFFPNSQRAMPKTNEEQMMNELKTGRALGGNTVLEDPDDEPGAEMAKGARVWRTYVKETDRWDKEMVDGRNKFIIESLGDLKPDYAESSAKALIAISQKLDAMISDQQIMPSSNQTSNLDTFSPSHSSVIVNILWLLSLTLSVAVSLIAMLAKEWCYKFMIGRSGPIYEQGRRRQQKWNGMEKWKMQEVLTYLPGLMHIALLLFAVGLCIYLWDVNVGVAIPVTAVTSVATCIYIAVTVLPWLDQFCPYSTPVTSINNASTRYIVASLWGKVHRIVYLVVCIAYLLVGYPRWLESALKHLRDWIKPADSDTAAQSKEDAYTPMDAVTCQMLARMIVNCEDSHSVNVALQAISGARTGLPHTELANNGALELVEARLQACVQRDASSREYRLKNADTLYPALRYGRAYSMLASGDSYGSPYSWGPMDHDGTERRYLEWYYMSVVAEIQINLITYAENILVQSGALVTASTVHLYLSYFGLQRPTSGLNFLISSRDIDTLGTLLNRHVVSEATQIPEPALLALLESCPFFMIGRWPLEENHNESPLPSILVCLSLISRDTAPDIARIIAFTLAATTFGMNSYPGDEQPAVTMEDRMKRAMKVLRHYQEVKPTAAQVDEMFTFGLIGLLPHMSLEALKTFSVASLSKLHNIITRTLNNSRQYGIFTLPKSYNWSAHLTSSYQRLMPKDTLDPALPNTASFYLLLLRAWKPHQDRSFVPILSLFCSVQSKEIKDACIDALSSQPITGNKLQLSAPWEYESQLRELLRYLFASGRHLDFVATFYFKLLMATTMLQSDIDLSDRQSRLKPLVDCHDEFKRLTPTLSDNELPSEEKILEQVKEQTSRKNKHADHLLRTMQLVVDFCHADPDKVPHPEPTQAGSEETASWVAKLQEIKDQFDSTLRSWLDAENRYRVP